MSNTNAIASRAMLANVSIWEARKQDKKLTAEVNHAHNAKDDTARVHKSLISRAALSAIDGIAREARRMHYARTLPWADSGTRILSNEGFAAWADKVARPDAEAAASYLASKCTHPAMVAFLRFRGPDTVNAQGVVTRPGLIHGKAAQGEHAFPSSRAWAAVAEMIDLPPADRFDLAKGTVGTFAATEFEAFVESYAAIVGLMSEIFARPESATVPQEPSLCYAVASAVAARADFSNWNAVNTYAARMPVEFGICTILDAVARDSRLKNTAQYGAWAVANKSVALS